MVYLYKPPMNVHMNYYIEKHDMTIILDALECYEKDYSVSVAATKTLQQLKKKLKKLSTQRNRRTYESFCQSTTR